MNDTNKAWILTVNMGYGHQRAVHGLEFAANEEIITVNDSEHTSVKEKKIWKRMLKSYESVSRAKSIPLIGNYIFKILDLLLKIPDFYPKRNLSEKTYQVKLLNYYLKKGLCKGVLNKIKDTDYPLITSFYAPALAADKENFKDIYLIICDSDLNRVWVAENPAISNIKYFVPCYKAAQRLKSYGVSKEKIFLTGFPFSEILTGNSELETLKHDLSQRLFYLDPNRRFHKVHDIEINHYLGEQNSSFSNERILTLMFAVGGAGAQKEVARKIVIGLSELLATGKIKLILSAGTRKEVKVFFDKIAQMFGQISNIEIIFSETKNEYLKKFDTAIRKTDILWTKPSELVFYAGLGIPIIMTPAIGAQEIANKQWIHEIQAGFKQQNPLYTKEWLLDFLGQGRLAEAAWSGFLKARKCGTYKIMEVLKTGQLLKKDSPLER